MVQLGLWISTNSSHGFVARSNFVFLTTQFQVCHGNTATFFIELRDETTIISVDGTTGIVVKCWVSSRRNIDRASVEGFQSHHAMLLILLGAARLISCHPHSCAEDMVWIIFIQCALQYVQLKEEQTSFLCSFLLVSLSSDFAKSFMKNVRCLQLH